MDNKSLAELVTDALRRKEYSSSKHVYQGVVENNKDPQKIGRCQVRVFGVYGDGISSELLPWALPDNLFVGSEKGSMVVPPVGSLVNVYFENDDMYLPKYTTKVIQQSKLSDMSSGWDDDYPETMTFFETDQGDYFRVNRKNMTCTFKHASGVKFTIDKNGNTKIDTTSKDGKFTISVGGDANIEAEGNVVVSSGLGKNISLVTGDGSTALWEPNVIPTCPFTGLPHSISGLTGMKTLKGDE